jgi:hypothetical protein
MQLSKSDFFHQGVNYAMKAANLTQIAKSSQEWKIVMDNWQKSINLMSRIPSFTIDYAIAQQKIIEYRRNLHYAYKNTKLSN